MTPDDVQAAVLECEEQGLGYEDRYRIRMVNNARVMAKVHKWPSDMMPPTEMDQERHAIRGRKRPWAPKSLEVIAKLDDEWRKTSWFAEQCDCASITAFGALKTAQKYRLAESMMLDGNNRIWRSPQTVRRRIETEIADEWKTSREIAEATGIDQHTVAGTLRRIYLDGAIERRTTAKSIGGGKRPSIWEWRKV